MKYFITASIIGILGIGILLAFNNPSLKTAANPDKEPIQATARGEIASGRDSTLSIPALNLTAPVIFLNSTKEDDIQNALKSGVVHYAGTALPGQTGNAYIVGHSSDLPWTEGKFKSVFAKLPEIETGDLIKITEQTREHSYKVIETKIVKADDLSVLNQPSDKKLLTLQTSYPLGTALGRFIVVAELVILQTNR